MHLVYYMKTNNKASMLVDKKPAEIIYNYLKVVFDDQTQLKCKKKDGSNIIYTKKTSGPHCNSALIKQASLCGLIDEKLTGQKSPIFNLIKISQQSSIKLQKISALIFEQFKKNFYPSESEYDTIKTELSKALNSQAMHYYDLI